MAAAANVRWIIVPDWEEFQHRDAARVLVPTWLKTFTRLLSNNAYLDLTGHRRAVLHGLWMEYARSLRLLPDDTASLSRRLALKVTRTDLEALNDAGFIHFSASKPASSDASTLAGTEKRRELQNQGLLTEPQYAEPEPTLVDDAGREPDRQPSDIAHIQTAITASLAQAKGAAAA